MNVEIEATVATMDVLVSRVRVVIAVIEKAVAILEDAIASVSRFISIGGVSLSAVAPDLALHEGPEALV